MPCLKKCFKTRKTAKAEMKKLNHTGKVKLTSVYYCQECSSYHMTSMDKQEYRIYINKVNRKLK